MNSILLRYLHSHCSTKAKGILLTLSFCCYFFTPASAQNLDSLRLLLSQSQLDTNQVNLLNDLAWELKFNEPDEARQFLEQSAQLSQQLNFPKGEAQAYNNRGVVETIDGQYDRAIEYYESALALRQSLQDTKGVASLYNNIGNLQNELGNYPAALTNLRESLKLRQALNDTLRIARVSYNISLTHEAMGNYPEALDFALRHLSVSELLEDKYEMANAYNLIGNIKSELESFTEAADFYQKALDLRQELGDPLEVAQTLQNMGNIKDDFGERALDSSQYTLAAQGFQEALAYYEQALKTYQENEDDHGISGAYNNMGLVYKNLGSFYKKRQIPDSAAISLNQAIVYLEQSLLLRQQQEDQRGIMEVYNGLGDVKRRQGQLSEALQYTMKCLAIAQELDDGKFIQGAYKDISRVYAEQKQFEKAYDYRKRYDELRYVRLSEAKTRQNARREAIYGDEKKQQAIERQNAELALQDAQLQRAALYRNSLAGGAILLGLLALLLFNRYRIKSKANEKLAEKNEIIAAAQERSEELLLNILPAETAQELKVNGKTQAKSYESVTVLFTDFASFTQISSTLSAEKLVAILDDYFRAFDEITTRYGIEKIKTIGDAYMCAGGIPRSRPDHAQQTIKAALAMQVAVERLAKKYPLEKERSFKARIGIHTGPVVAGVVGSKKFAYDIWGDTVNIAARMESAGEVGKINISQSTYDLVKEEFSCVHRGKIKAKSLGEIDMYFVEND